MDKEKTYKETPKQKKSASGIWAWILWILLTAIGTIAAIGTQKIWDVVGLLSEQRDCREPGSPECRGPGSPECRGIGCPECRIVGIPASIDISKTGQQDQAPTRSWQ